MAKLTKLEQKSYEEVIEATMQESFVYLAEEFYQPLVEAGLVEINLEITQVVEGETRVATRALNIPAIEPIKTKGEEKMSFEIETGVAMPVAAKRGGSRTSAYPFDKLEVGQSFFIPATEKHPEPAKTLASTVSGATKRYDVLVFEEDGTTPKMKEVTNPKTKEKKTVQATAHTRIFKLVVGEKDGVAGARVFRTA